MFAVSSINKSFRVLLPAAFFLIATGTFALDDYPTVPDVFYRVGLVEWEHLKDVGEGKRMLNIFRNKGDAAHFLAMRWRGADRNIYELSKADMAKTTEGRAFLAQVERILERTPNLGEFELLMSSAESYSETVRQNVRVSPHGGHDTYFATGDDIFGLGTTDDPAFWGSRREAPETTPAAEESTRTAEESPRTAEVESRPPSVPEGSRVDPQYTDPENKRLYELIRDKPAGQFDADFFEEVYRTPEAKERLKTIFSLPDAAIQDKSRRLANLRKDDAYRRIAGEARDNYTIIEVTNQGKDNGARSDFDGTLNKHHFDESSGRWVLIDDGSTQALISRVEAGYQERLNGADNVDVSFFNGDQWLPDWRDSRMSYDEFQKRTYKSVYQLKHGNPDAYYVPGANKEQPHDRALREGKTSLIAWDYINDRPTLNDRPFTFDVENGLIVDVETGEPIREISTRQMVLEGRGLRYQGVEPLAAPEQWRRALGNTVQNLKEFLKQQNAVDRNKYFIERAIDQGVGRFTDLYKHTYMEVHGGTMPEGEKAAWKKVFIQQAFGLPEGSSRIGEIQSVLDRSAEIWLDKTGGWHDGHTASYDERAKSRNGYYAGELERAEQNIWNRFESDSLQPLQNREQLVVREAERLFAEKQRNLMIEAATMVVEETLHRNFTLEGARRNRSVYEVRGASKIMFENGVEIALLADMIETAPSLDEAARKALHERVSRAVPAEVKPLVSRLAELSRLKLNLLGRPTSDPWTRAERSRTPLRPTELIARAEADIQRLLGDVESRPPIPDDRVKQYIGESISEFLGPVEGPVFNRAWMEGNARLAGKAYWNSIKNQADRLMLTGTAMGMLEAYQWHCADQLTWNEDCLSALGWRAGHESLMLLPGINSGYMVLSGLRELRMGHPQWFISFGCGIASLPQAARLFGATSGGIIKTCVAVGLTRLTYSVTYGYLSYKYQNDVVEQAFKAMPDGSAQARRFHYPSEPSQSSLQARRPTIPLLADEIPAVFDFDEPIDVEGTDQYQRALIAAQLHAPAIQAELEELGLQPGTEAWNDRRNEIIFRYGEELPYTARVRKIYEFFRPRVLQGLGTEDPSYLADCLRANRDIVEEKHLEAGEKQKALNEAFSHCLVKAAEYEPRLEEVFDDYLTDWYAKQEGDYGDKYDTETIRDALRKSLVRHYLIERHRALNPQELELPMKQAADVAGQASEVRQKTLGHLLYAQEQAAQDTGPWQQAAARLEEELAAQLPEVPPELELGAPSHAVHWGEEPALVDIEARGEYDQQDEDKNEWKPVLTSQIDSVSLGEPDNLVMTKPLEEALAGKPEGPRYQMVEIVEQVKSELHTGGEVQAVAQAPATVKYFDLLPWWGEVAVEVRAAGPDTKDLSDRQQTYPYAGATVKLSGAAQGEEESVWWTLDLGQDFGYAGAAFKNLPPGAFGIHVEPADGDALHSAAEASADLADFIPALGWDPSGNMEEYGNWKVLTQRFPDEPLERLTLVRWKDAETITVVLPYEAPTEEEAEEEEESPTETEEGPEVSGEEETEGEESSGEEGSEEEGSEEKGTEEESQIGPGGPDPAQVQACEEAVAEAAQMAAAGDLAAAAEIQRHIDASCRGLSAATEQEIENLAQQLQQLIQSLTERIALRQQECEFEDALRQARELEGIDPAHPWLAANLGQLELLAESQRQARLPLREAQMAIEAKDINGAIARLEQALTVQYFPSCMTDTITNLLTELRYRNRFFSLTEQVEEATRQCNYPEAERLINEIAGVTPRYTFIAEWLEPATIRLADLQDRERRALGHLQRASELTGQSEAMAAASPPDWDQISPVLAQAAQALAEAENVAPNCVRDRENPTIGAIRNRILDAQRNRKSPIQTSIVLLIDTSGSMGDANKIQQAKRAARSSVSKVSQTTEMAVLNFDGGCNPGAVHVAHPFSTDAASLMRAIDGLTPGGGTPMYIATAVAVDYAAKNGRGKTGLVVLMSDGADSCGGGQQIQAADTIRTSNIPVNTIGFDVRNNADAQADLENLAKMSRGRSYSAGAADPKEIIRAFNLALLPSLLKAWPGASGSASAAVQGFFDQGLSMVERQDTAGALSQFQKAHDLAPDSPAVNYNLSLLYEAEDQLIAATRHAREYMKLSPAALDSVDVQARIANLEEELRRNPRAEFDPSGCRDLYVWARKEQNVADKSKNVTRRQAIMEIRIAAQRGECQKAEQLAAQYKQQYVIQ